MRKAIILLLLLFVIPLTSAITSEFVFEKDTQPELPFTCTDSFTGLPCSSAYSCNVTIKYPNGTFLIDNIEMTHSGQTYSIGLDNLSVNGFYSYSGYCSNTTNGGSSDDLAFQVTQTGKVFSESQGVTGLGILGGVVLLSGLFMFLGFRLSDNPKLLPLTLVFVFIALALALYSLQLGFAFSVDILEYDSLSSLQSTIFLTVLFLVIGIAIISFILMTTSFLREFGKGKMMNDFGEGFDPITQTYK